MMSPKRNSIIALISLASICLFIVYWRQASHIIELIETEHKEGQGQLTKVIHSSQVYLQHISVDNNQRRLPNVDPNVYTFTVDKLPDDVRLYPSLGNGHLGLVVHGNRIHMNGLYNGHMTRSHRAAIPSTCQVMFVGTTPFSSYHSQFTLDASSGTYQETHTSSHVKVAQVQYAHRTVLPLLVLEIDLLRNGSTQSGVQILLNTSRWYASDDITFKEEHSGISGVRYKSGHIKEPETATSGKTPVHVYFDKVPNILKSAPGVLRTKWMFLTAIHTSKAKAKTAYLLGRSLIQSAQLRRLHTEAWLRRWQEGRIDVAGNPVLARAIYGSYYYLLSSVPGKPDPDWPFVGLSPCGLAWGGGNTDTYLGHVFWDQETWMLPPLLFLHSDLGRTILDTRKRTAVSASRNARLNDHAGLQYPWESAFTGMETCPDHIDATQEVHISGDVALGILQYVRVTGDHSLITDEGFGKIVMGLGDFWISMLTLNKTSDLYEIHGIQPPDEWHWNVNNSVYTNVIAKLTLLAADMAVNLLNTSQTHHYKDYADRMYVPYDVNAQYHPEYDGYVNGTVVKQADVILIGFPLMYNMSSNVRRNDLHIYEQATSRNGPAMTWSMFLIGLLELSERSKAADMLQRSYSYIASEFQVWTEQINSSGATNFNTGQGGFLQSMIFGYGGFRLYDHHLTIDPVLPPDCNQMNFTGIDYLGSSLDFVFDAASDMTKVTVTRQGVAASTLLLRVSATESYVLELKKTVVVPMMKVAIVPLQ